MAKGKLHKPTAESKKMVETLSGFGITQEQVARHLNISVDCLVTHYREQIDSGIIKANSAVTKNLFKIASTSSNPVAAMFWCKTRLGWKEVQHMEVEGKNGQPLIAVIKEK